jgi:hypothetical protein
MYQQTILLLQVVVAVVQAMQVAVVQEVIKLLQLYYLHLLHTQSQLEVAVQVELDQIQVFKDLIQFYQEQA